MRRESIEALMIVCVLLGLGGLLLAGCESEAEEKLEASETESEEIHYYSPYYLTGEGDLVFRTITYTDVGIRQPGEGPVDPEVLEAFSEALAGRLMAMEGIEYDVEVKHDPSQADPSEHLFCEGEHLYIALWHGYEPERWGFSLWSGCEAHHEFAWEEIEDPLERGVEDLSERLAPLVDRIAAKVEEAHHTGCYLTSC